MKPVTVAVFMKEPAHGQELARGLAERNTAFHIMVFEAEITPETEWEVLVTDFDVKVDAGQEFWASRGIRLTEPCSISQISEMIVKRVSCLRGGWMNTADGKNICHTAAFFSRWGGSGVTSLALSVGRILSGAFGERVLYLPFTCRDGSLDYRDAGFQHKTEGAGTLCRGQELVYRMKYDRLSCLSSFVSEDEYGLHYLSVQNGEENILAGLDLEELTQFYAHLQEVGGYDWIVADWGSMSPKEWFSFSIYVENMQDSRTGYCQSHYPVDSGRTEKDGKAVCETGTCKIILQNHGLENRLTDRYDGTAFVEIIHDGESFLTRDDGCVEISLNKSFSEGVKIIADYLMEAVANSVESW